MSAKKSFLARLFQGKPESDCCQVSIVEDEPTPEEPLPGTATAEPGRTADNANANTEGSRVQNG